MKKIYLSLFFSIFFLITWAQPMERLQQGKLENGLTYYIKHSELQPGQVSFYLVQNVGAILENDSENGLAHFLEHMAFNGTEHFPNELMPYLRNEGIYTFNAHTGINETVYNLDDIPLSNKRVVDTCIYILKDWCNGVLLKEKDIDEERKIIIEEWRTRHTLSRRLIEAAAPYVYNHSKYAERNVIGTVENLQSFPADTLRAFYKKWYRPDLQCVIIVGDIDENQWENRLKEVLGQIPATRNPIPLPEIRIEENDSPIYGLLLDPENRSRSITLQQRVAKRPHASDEARRKYSFSARFFNQLWQERLGRLRNANEEKYLSASVSFTSFIKGYNGMRMEIVPFSQQDSAAFDQIWTLWEQIRRYGFSENEIRQVQEKEYNNLSELQKNLDKNRNNYYVSVFKNHFLQGTPYYDLAEEAEKNIETVLEYTADDMNEWIRSWADERNIAVVVAGNTPDYPYLTEKQVNAILTAGSRKKIEQQREQKEIPTLFDLALKPGKITKTKAIKGLEAEIWTLSNGTEVVYKYVAENKGFFSMACSSHGGRSVVDAKDLPSLDAMQSLVLKSGLYKFDRNTVQDIVRGKNIKANLFLNEWTEGIGGGTLTQNAELFFQFIYLMFEKPLFTEEQFDKFVQRQRYIYENTPKTGLNVIQDSIRKLTVLQSDRTRDFDLSYIDDMDFAKVESLYRKRFSNARDFIFCIVGDLSREEAQRLSCRYIATLPAKKGKKEKFILHDYTVKDSAIVRKFDVEMQDDKSIIDISFENNVTFNNKEQLAFDIFGQMLRNRFFKIIREEQSGAYGVNVNTVYDVFPELRESLAINFQTNSEQAEALRELVLRELEKSHTQLFTSGELRQILISKKQEKVMQEETKGIDYWLRVLNYYIEFGIDLTTPGHFDEIIDTITLEDIRQVAQKFFNSARKKDILIKAKQENNEGGIF